MHLRGITNAKGELMVLATHNTDIQDAWEREGEDPEYFYTYSPNGYATAMNIMLLRDEPLAALRRGDGSSLDSEFVLGARQPTLH